MLGQFSWEEESDSSLDFSGGEGVLLVVADELGGLEGDLLEDVIDEGVHDAHGSLGDAGVGVHLLQDLVDVDGVGLLALAVLLLVALGDVLLGLASLLGGLSGGLGGHGDGVGESVVQEKLMLLTCFCCPFMLEQWLAVFPDSKSNIFSWRVD